MTTATTSQRTTPKMPGLAKHIAARVRRQRETDHLTQGDLAERAGVNRSTITRLESGRTKDPPTSLIERVAQALGVEVREFFPHLTAVESIRDRMARPSGVAVPPSAVPPSTS